MSPQKKTAPAYVALFDGSISADLVRFEREGDDVFIVFGHPASGAVLTRQPFDMDAFMDWIGRPRL